MAKVIAPTRKRLTDLYMKGRPLSIADDDPDAEGIPVWVSKITPLQRKNASEKANSARVSTLALKKLAEDSDEKMSYRDQFMSLGLETRDDLIDFVIGPELQKVRFALEAEVGAKDEWSENDYLISLQDAWNDSLEAKYAEDPEHPEAKRVFEALSKFSDEVEALVEADKEGLVKDYADFTDERLQAMVVDRIIEIESDIKWIVEFRKWQIFYAIRDPENHKELYFLDKIEIDELDDRVFNELYAAFEDLTVDTLEGKD
jgi:hypothetical protein